MQVVGREAVGQAQVGLGWTCFYIYPRSLDIKDNRKKTEVGKQGKECT